MSLDVKIKQLMSKTIKMHAVSLKLKFEHQYIVSINVYRCFNSRKLSNKIRYDK